MPDYRFIQAKIGNDDLFWSRSEARIAVTSECLRSGLEYHEGLREGWGAIPQAHGMEEVLGRSDAFLSLLQAAYPDAVWIGIPSSQPPEVLQEGEEERVY
jgi:hypothetical protein